jgi:hypothetical protein
MRLIIYILVIVLSWFRPQMDSAPYTKTDEEISIGSITVFGGVPGGIRTPGLMFRRHSL